MQPTFKALGLSYRNTPLEIREELAFDEDRTKQFLRNLNTTFGIGEAMVLSTCNRTEIYYSAENPLKSEILTLLALEQQSTNKEQLGEYLEEFDTPEAIEQLYKVSLGLDSKVLGDIQISNQIKKAYQWSADEGMAGPFLHRLMHSIFYANKRVVQETCFRDGAASVAYVSVELVKQFVPNFEHPKVLVLGVGEIGTNIAENLEGCQANIVVANRTYEKAQNIGDRLGYDVVAFEEAISSINDYDVVISSLFSAKPVITSEQFHDNIKQKLLIDLSVPRSISAEVGELHHVWLYNVDQLEQKTSEALSKREGAIPEVQNILNESLQEFSNWTQEMEVSPTIQKLKNALEEIRQRELAKYVKKVNEDELKLLDSATKGIIQKVLRLPVLQLKAACKRGEADTLVETLNDLFNLESDQVPK